jgi:hypothetical protein
MIITKPITIHAIIDGTPVTRARCNAGKLVEPVVC